MDSSQFVSLADQLRTRPAADPVRGRAQSRLTELSASAEVVAALESAAARMGEDDGALATVIRSARALWTGRDADLSGDDSAARIALGDAAASPEFVASMPALVRELRGVASSHPETGACTLASALQLWAWTMNHFRMGEGARGVWAPGAVAELADLLCPLLAGRALAIEIAGQAPVSGGANGPLRADLCHVHAARAAASTGASCAELVFGYRPHHVWDAEGCASCYRGEEVDDLEGLIPGIASSARASGDLIEADGSHAAKAGPCARFDGVDAFVRLRSKLDGCLTGARFAKDRASAALAHAATTNASASTASQERQ